MSHCQLLKLELNSLNSTITIKLDGCRKGASWKFKWSRTLLRAKLRPYLSWNELGAKAGLRGGHTNRCFLPTLICLLFL